MPRHTFKFSSQKQHHTARPRQLTEREEKKKKEKEEATLALALIHNKLNLHLFLGPPELMTEWGVVLTPLLTDI
jgi:hypothetical protein